MDADFAIKSFIEQLNPEQLFGLSLGVRNPKRAGWTHKTMVGGAAARQPKAYAKFEKWANGAESGPPGLVLCGEPGVGKTGLAISLLKTRALSQILRSDSDLRSDAWLRSQPKVLALYLTNPDARLQRPASFWYETWVDLVRRVTAGSQERQSREILWSRYADTVVLDELDAVANGMVWLRDGVLQEIVERADVPHWRTILIVNSPPSAFKTLFGARIADRIKNPTMYRILELR